MIKMAKTNRPEHCSTCILEENSLCSGFAPAFGRGSLGVLVIAEALGEKEARESRPLVPQAQAGSVFARALKRMALDETQFTIMNTINCRPKDNKLENEWYEDAAIAHCKHYIDEVVTRTKPRAILTLGNVPLRSQTGLTGAGRTVSALRGYILPSQHYTTQSHSPIPVIGSYHPSFIARGNEKYLGVLTADIAKAIKVASGKLIEDVDYIFDPISANNDPFNSALQYTTNPTDHDIRHFLEVIKTNPQLLIAYDIETNFTRKGKGEDEYEISADDKITQIQFSLGPGTGIALPWNNDIREVAGRILGSPNPKAAHNGWRFDNPIIKGTGIGIAGVNLDTMTMFHHLHPDLPADLQFVGSLYGMPFPWKHYNDVDIAFYGIADVDAVQRIFQKLPEDMQKRKVWESYVEMVVGLQPELEDMARRGIHMDIERRADFRKEIETEKAKVNGELQVEVPENVKPSKVSKQWPVFMRGVIKKYSADYWAWRKLQTGEKELDRMLKISEVPENTKAALMSDLSSAYPEEIKGYTWYGDKLTHIGDFLPNSTDHLKKLILHYGEKVPKNLDGDDTTARLELERLVEKLKSDANKLEKQIKPGKVDKTVAMLSKRKLSQLIEQSIEYRRLNKIGSTYIDGWHVTPEDPYVHTTFTFAPATWQLSSKDPNIQNGPAHGELAKKFKRLQIASPGCTLIAADYGGCHLKTLAFEMEDLNYYRMACIDGHSTIGLIAMGYITPEKLFEMTDDEWRERCKWFKSDPDRLMKRQKQFKPALLGIQLGLMGRKLYDNNRDNFNNEKEAQKIIDLIKNIYPNVPKWQSWVKDLAHRQGYLLSRYGGIRWFWSVKRWDAIRGKEVAGDDAEKAIAFFVQNDAFGKKRESMLDLRREGLTEKYRMNNDIHDAAYFDCPNEYLDEALVNIKRIMESPARKLVNKTWPDGLKIGVEINIGPNLGELMEVKI